MLKPSQAQWTGALGAVLAALFVAVAIIVRSYAADTDSNTIAIRGLVTTAELQQQTIDGQRDNIKELARLVQVEAEQRQQVNLSIERIATELRVREEQRRGRGDSE